MFAFSVNDVRAAQSAMSDFEALNGKPSRRWWAVRAGLPTLHSTIDGRTAAIAIPTKG